MQVVLHGVLVLGGVAAAATADAKVLDVRVVRFCC